MPHKSISVSQLNHYIKRIMENDPILEDLSIKGEISNLKYHSSGHVYFTLKDSKSKINCFLPYDNIKNVNTVLNDGMEIICTGKISVVEKGGYYSFYAKYIDIEGEGQLSVTFEALKQKLSEEGLFDKNRKKKLPEFPEKIGVITAGEGAAVKDILKILTEKNSYVDIVVIPCLVQGPLAPKDISDKIRLANSLPDIDILIVGRGGGSLEELWAFNEEIVARSIYDSKIPVISAVGHETDITIADFVADVRAETPTAAANLAVPSTDELLEQINFLKNDMLYSLEAKIKIYRNRIDNIIMLIGMYAGNHLNKLKWKLENLKNTVETLNPGNILKKGYCISVDVDGKWIKSVDEINIGQSFSTIFADGSIKNIVKEKSTERQQHGFQDGNAKA